MANHYEVLSTGFSGARGILNGHRWLNVPVKGSEVVILLDNPLLGSPYEPWCAALHFSYSSALSVHHSLSINHSCYTVPVGGLVRGPYPFNPRLSEVPLRHKLCLIHCVQGRKDADIWSEKNPSFDADFILQLMYSTCLDLIYCVIS